MLSYNKILYTRLGCRPACGNTFFLIILSVIIHLATATQIVVPPQSQTVPVSSVAKFTCRTTAFVVWQIDSGRLMSDSPTSVAAFQMRGIGVDSDNGSVLLVNATLENNGTNITCRTGPDVSRPNVMSTTAILTVFGESGKECIAFQITWFPFFLFQNSSPSSSH